MLIGGCFDSLSVPILVDASRMIIASEMSRASTVRVSSNAFHPMIVTRARCARSTDVNHRPFGTQI